MQYKQDTPSTRRHLNSEDKMSVSYQERNSKNPTDKIIRFRGVKTWLQFALPECTEPSPVPVFTSCRYHGLDWRNMAGWTDYSILDCWSEWDWSGCSAWIGGLEWLKWLSCSGRVLFFKLEIFFRGPTWVFERVNVSEYRPTSSRLNRSAW